MAHEHKDILFEGRDTQDKKIFNLGILLFAVMIGCSMLMIPLVKYLWHWAGTVNPKAEKSTLVAAPAVILEVHPNHDLKKMQAEYQANHSQDAIKAAIQTTLSEGLPAEGSK